MFPVGRFTCRRHRSDVIVAVVIVMSSLHCLEPCDVDKECNSSSDVDSNGGRCDTSIGSEIQATGGGFGWPWQQCLMADSSDSQTDGMSVIRSSISNLSRFVSSTGDSGSRACLSDVFGEAVEKESKTLNLKTNKAGFELGPHILLKSIEAKGEPSIDNEKDALFVDRMTRFKTEILDGGSKREEGIGRANSRVTLVKNPNDLEVIEGPQAGKVVDKSKMIDEGDKIAETQAATSMNNILFDSMRYERDMALAKASQIEEELKALKVSNQPSEARLWGKSGLVDVLSNEEGFFYFISYSCTSRDSVMEDDSWHLCNLPIIMKKWHRMLKLSKNNIKVIPVWAKFYNIPLEFWDEEGLSEIASEVGKPLHVDLLTKRMSRVSFARVCVEIATNSEPTDSFLIQSQDEVIEISVEYLILPLRYDHSHTFGHSLAECMKKTPIQIPEVVAGEEWQHVPTKNGKVVVLDSGVEIIDMDVEMAKEVAQLGDRSGINFISASDSGKLPQLELATAATILKRYIGYQFTWANKQGDWNYISTKIDRVLVNEVQMRTYPQSNAIFLPPGVSDLL
ncbi:hypothetical protein Acr_07g0013050 [Actinidia rufa]|uniref:DUF4283 domain-containing protein n=1 Tax=Actinidia rufa TaxID=165716 RepID=A0A7J0EYP9_9ERIC|nr:hypothetical protein Acr_07g0013050 [Actinidia rufa]